MPPPASVDRLACLDELDARMRRTAARLSMLADTVIASAGSPEGAAAAADHLAAASALSTYVPELAHAADRLAGVVADLAPRPDTPPDTIARLSLAELERASAGDRGALERAAGWASGLSDIGGAEGEPGAVVALALAKAAAATGEAGLREAAAREVERLPAEGPGAVVAARALVALGGEEALARAGRACDRIGLCGEDGTGAGAGTDPVATADGVMLACELWAASQDSRHLDAVERLALNDLLFEQTDDGGAAAGRTLDGEPGEVDDGAATPALALGLAAVARQCLAVDAEGRVLAGIPANASALVRIGERTEMRCLVSTQLPVRGWTKWTFEPVKPGAVPVASASTRRPARRQRMVQAAAGPAEEPARPGEGRPATFGFVVRVPGWASAAGGPAVKIDKQKANVKRSGGFLCFEVPTDRATEIEVVVPIGPGVTERQSPVSWAREAAVTYGPLVLTASARLNGGESLSMPLRITSPVGELAAVTDIRRRLPVVEAKALGGGGRVIPVLFSPLSEVGGLSEGLGGVRAVRCAPFRTWHRLGR